MKIELQIDKEQNKIYIPLKNQWNILTPEEEVRQSFIVKLVNEYGYSLEQMEQELKVTTSDRGTGRASADLVIWKTKEDRLTKKTAFMVVELKAEKVGIREKDFYQGYNYATWARANIFVASNFIETKVFKVIEDELPLKLSRISEIPYNKDIQDEEKLNKFLTKTQVFKRDEFAKLLYQCHNVIRNNDKLSPEAAFDEISKILFMKIRYERNPIKHSIFSEKHFEEGELHYKTNIQPYLTGEDKNASYIEFLFRQTKEEFKTDELFETNEKINIKDSSFKQIVRMLEVYNLSETSEDIKGIAFEGFLGRTFRGELGQFFTPRTVVDFIIELIDPKEKELVCDPCCGSGGFLIKAFEYIREKIEKDIDEEKDIIKKKYLGENFENIENEEINKKVEEELLKLNEQLIISKNKDKNETRLDHLSRDCIYGTDANPRMARVSKMNMIMHGDGHGGVHHNDGLLNINGIFENRFDVIVTNPPFGARVDSEQKIQESDKYKDTLKKEYYINKYGEEYKTALKQVEENIGNSILSLYKVGQFSGLTEVLFIERCLNLLKPNGRMGIVLPEGVFNSANLEKVRKFFERKAKIILIVSLPQEVFLASKATVKTSILFMKKFSDEETKSINDIEKKIREKYNSKNEDLRKEIIEIEEQLSTTKNIIKDRMKEKKEKDADKKSLEEKILEWKEIEANFNTQKNKLKKELNSKIKENEKLMEIEIEKTIKNELDYEIPIAEIDKAGIDSSGKNIDNQLPILLEEFRTYRKNKEVW